MADQVSNHFLNRCAHHIQLGERRVSFLVRRAYVRFLPRNELGINQEPMLEVVDAELRSLTKTHCAKMPRDFQTAFVSCLDYRSEFSVRDVSVALKRGNALVGPVLYRFACVLWAGEVVHLRVGR